jgi:hypothetical protein
MPLPASVARLVESQLGVVARQQLHTRMPGEHADALLRGPWFEQVEHGVHRVVGGARLAEQAAVAAALRAGPGATLSGPVVLALYNVDGFVGDEPFVVLTPPGRRLRGVGFPHRRDPDPRRPTGARGEVRLVGPMDALIDSAPFAEEIGVRRLRLAHDVLRWRGVLRPGTLIERTSELGRHNPGCAALAELLELDGQVSTGDGERTLGRLLSRFRPAPEPEVWVTPHRRVDWYFRSVRVGYEYQGPVDHATLVGRLADAQRDVELRRAGIHLAHLVAADLDDERALLATVAGTLTARAHELGVSPPVLAPS